MQILENARGAPNGYMHPHGRRWQSSRKENGMHPISRVDLRATRTHAVHVPLEAAFIEFDRRNRLRDERCRLVKDDQSTRFQMLREPAQHRRLIEVVHQDITTNHSIERLLEPHLGGIAMLK